MEFAQVRTICDLLQRAAGDHPRRGLTFIDDGNEVFISYPDLLEKSQANGELLRRSQIVQNRSIVLICMGDHMSNIIWTWSVIAAGGVPAILPPFSNDPKTRDGQLQNLIALFGKPKVLASRATAKQLKSLSGANVQVVEDFQSSVTEDLPVCGVFGYGAHAPESCAALLFTSGSTGHSKAVEFTHRQLIASVRAKQQMHKLEESVSFLLWVSFDHSANFCELHLNSMNVGSNQYFVTAWELAHEPQKFFEYLGRLRIGYTFSPNSFLAASSKAWREQTYETDQYSFQHLKVVMVGGEANKVVNIQEADRLFRLGGAGPHAVKAAYGLSETCSACFYNLQAPSWDVGQGNIFATVGKHLPVGIELRIVDEDLNPVSQGADGNIQLSGDIIFQRYFNDAAATAACTTPDGWFDTGDLGRLDSQGNLSIVGRSKEILILGGNNYSSFELENAIESRKIPGVSVSWTASFSVWDHDKDTEGVVVLFNPTEQITSCEGQMRVTVSRIKSAVLLFCSTTPLDVVPLPRTEMPKSTIGKLSRQKLKKFYLEGQFDKYRVDVSNDLASSVSAPKPFTTEMQRTAAKVLSEQTGVSIDEIGTNTELIQFGLSSIAYLRLKRSLEVAVDRLETPIPMGSLLEVQTVEELANLVGTREKSEYRPLVTLRSEGSKTPVFLFPPAGGEFVLWLPILQHLPDRPIYALQVKGIEANSKSTFESLEEMLNAYESAILAVRPHGPYALLGLCFGGTTAFELGKRFEARGQTLSFCGGLDNAPELQKVLRTVGDRASVAEFLINLLAYHGVISDAEIPALEKHYRALPETDVVAAITAKYQDEGMRNAGLHAEKLKSWHRVNSRAHDFSRRYVPTGTVSAYNVFWAKPYSGWNISGEDWEGFIRKWDVHTRNGCEYRLVPGHHFSLLHKENIGILAREIEEAMDEREKILNERGLGG